MPQIPNTKRKYDLEERTLKFAHEVIALCQSLSYNSVNRELISQVVRASGSVGANYREANEALSKKDFAHRIRIARKEAKEAQYWLQLLEGANATSASQVSMLREEAVALRKILSVIAERVS